MTAKVVVVQEAEQQLLEIDSWWVENRQAVPDHFLNEQRPEPRADRQGPRRSDDQRQALGFLWRVVGRRVFADRHRSADGSEQDP
jgi:hypothetical protein